ncbi:tetratricopeptide repeat protein [Sphingobium sp.]|uniref:tetratricopeptide repeat protein n=1 Tax=Sphingobium sp. TaxID=1912891 RepID=UPI0035C730DA
MADALAKGGAKDATERVSYDILASGRPDVALAFLESRPGHADPALWRLRFDLRRKTGDLQGANDLLRAAAMTPGAAPTKDLTEAAYALGQPDMLVTAAEHGAIPGLTKVQALDLANWANNAKRYDLIVRIDKAGGRGWRRDNPWLAMTLAQRSGDTGSALRYAALLPTGREAARESILMASGNRQAIRQLLLEQAEARNADQSAIAQRLLEQGFRSDAIALLRQQSGRLGSQNEISARMLYLMGPRPGEADLAWLRARALADRGWMPAYVERAQPAQALAFVESLPSADSSDMLVQRISLANIARDRAAAARAVDRLLDGRSLSAAELKAASSAVLPAQKAEYYSLALARARLAAGQGQMPDRLTLAWDAWNHGNARDAAQQLQSYLQAQPEDRGALRLMADAQEKLKGKDAAKFWLERLLATMPAPSIERAELLMRIGRTADAMAMVEMLRAAAPKDRRLDIMLARLLIVSGDPGRARKVLRP